MGMIKITLQSDLCSGIGEGSGNLVDLDYSSDRYGFPVIPARRLKGCLRQSAKMLAELGMITPDQVTELFGSAGDGQGKLGLRDAEVNGAKGMRQWLAGGNVPEALKRAAAPGSIRDLYSAVRGQTSLKDGIAEDKTLRYTRVLNRYDPLSEGRRDPMVFLAEAEVPEELRDCLKMCCQATRHIGMKRNRGLGMVAMEYMDGEADKKNPQEKEGAGAESVEENTDSLFRLENRAAERTKISYRIALDANLILSTAGENISYIPGRSVVGCVSGTYIRDKYAGKSVAETDEKLAQDEDFRELFLTGDVSWSDLTPAVGGTRSTACPLMLVYQANRDIYQNLYAEARTMHPEQIMLQSGRGSGVNLYGAATEQEEAKPKDSSNEKIKTLEGKWAAETEDGYLIAEVETEKVYHHRHRDSQGLEEMLYAHDSLRSQLVFEGYVLTNQKYTEQVQELLQKTRFRFGHSQNAQYAACRLIPYKTEEATENAGGKISVSAGSPVFVLLESDLMLERDGQYVTDCAAAREMISGELGLENRHPDGVIDYVQFRLTGGYHMKWQLQKPQIPVIRAGSTFCFTAKEDTAFEARRQIGENRHEGMGFCRIVPLEQMKRLTKISKSSVDNEQSHQPQEMSTRIKELKRAMLTDAAEHAISRGAVQKFEALKNDTALMNNLNNSRVRLMVEDAEDYKDLKKRIDSINREKAKEAARKFLKITLGKNDAPTEHLQIMMSGDTGLYNEIENDLDKLEIAELVKKQWKRYLRIILHMHDREKKRMERQNEAQKNQNASEGGADE